MSDYDQPDVVNKRVRFFDGQFLRHLDFIDEQHYHLDRERRSLRQLGTVGVLQGLDVSRANQNTLTVAPGIAVDALGRMIVLTAALNLTVAGDPFRQKTFQLHLVYREAETDIATVGSKGARRFDEAPMVAAVAPTGEVIVAPDAASQTWTGPTVLLASVTASDTFNLTVDTTVRSLAGLRMPGALSAVAGAVDGRLVSSETAYPYGSSGLYVGPWSAHALNLGSGGVARAVITPEGQFGVGRVPNNYEKWDRLVDFYGQTYTRLNVSTSSIDARVMAHPSQWNALAGMTIGTASSHAVTIVTNQLARLAVTTDGNVGIGATPDNSDPVDRLLDIWGSGKARITLRSDAVNSRMAVGSGLWSAPTGLVIGTGTRHPLTLATNGAARVVLDADGQLGFGRTPLADGETWDRIVEVWGSSRSRLGVRTDDIDARIMAAADMWWSPPGMVVGPGTSHSLTLATSGTAQVVVSPAGNVGIGQFPDITYPESSGSWGKTLDVTGAGSVRLSLRAGSPGTMRTPNSTSTVDGRLLTHTSGVYGAPAGMIVGTATGSPFSVITNQLSRLTVTAAGHVGIGDLPNITNPRLQTDMPGRIVDIKGSSGAHLKLRGNTVDAWLSTGGGDADPFRGGSGAGFFVGTASAHPFVIGTNGLERLTVASDGIVTLGNSPALRIALSGNAGQLSVGSDAFRVGAMNTVPTVLTAGGSDRVTVDANGMVGIGCTPNNSDGWDRLVEIYGGHHARLSVRADDSGGMEGRMVVNSNHWGAPDGMVLGTGTSHSVTLGANSKAQLVLTPEGDLGLGQYPDRSETTWSKTLDVTGSDSVRLSLRTGTGGSTRSASSTATIDGRVLVHPTGVYSSQPGMILGTRTNHALSLATNALTRVTVGPGGDVAIGGAVNADSRTGRSLDICDGTAANLALRANAVEGRLTAGSTPFTGAPTLGQFIGTKSAHAFGIGTNGVSRVTVDAGGLMDVTGGSGGTQTRWIRDGIYGVVSALDKDTADLSRGMIVGPSTKDNLTLMTSNIGRIWVNADGGVGIGSPTSALTSANQAKLGISAPVVATFSMSNRNGMEGRVMVNDGSYGGPGGMVVGTGSKDHLSFATSGASRMTLTKDGALGLGTAAPAARLQIDGTGSMLRLNRTDKAYGGFGNVLMELVQQNQADPFDAPINTPIMVRFQQAKGPNGDTPGYDLRISADASGFRFLDANNASVQLYARGFSQISDERYKTGIAELEGALDSVTRLRGVSFSWRDDGAESIGVIAQEVAAVLPEVVMADRTGHYSVDYGKLTAVLIQAVKEQQAQIDGLRELIN